MFDEGVVVNDFERNAWWEYKGAFTIKTTPEQDALITTYVEQRRRNPGRYNLLSGRHCGGFVQDALRAGGIDPFGHNVAHPGAVFEVLKALNDAGIDLMRHFPVPVP